WPLFGIANQLLAIVALCVATTILFKKVRARYALVTLVPLTVLTAIVFSAAYEKIWNPNPRIGFLADARRLSALPTKNTALIFNDRLDALLTFGLVFLVLLILIEGALLWARILMGRPAPQSREAPFQPSRFTPEEA